MTTYSPEATLIRRLANTALAEFDGASVDFVNDVQRLVRVCDHVDALIPAGLRKGPSLRQMLVAGLRLLQAAHMERIEDRYRSEDRRQYEAIFNPVPAAAQAHDPTTNGDANHAPPSIEELMAQLSKLPPDQTAAHVRRVEDLAARINAIADDATLSGAITVNLSATRQDFITIWGALRVYKHELLKLKVGADGGATQQAPDAVRDSVRAATEMLDKLASEKLRSELPALARRVNNIGRQIQQAVDESQRAGRTNVGLMMPLSSATLLGGAALVFTAELSKRSPKAADPADVPATKKEKAPSGA